MCELLFVQIVEWSFLLPLKYLLSLDLYVFLINQNFDIQNITKTIFDINNNIYIAIHIGLYLNIR